MEGDLTDDSANCKASSRSLLACLPLSADASSNACPGGVARAPNPNNVPVVTGAAAAALPIAGTPAAIPRAATGAPI